jgi:hypothetical protein
MLIVDLDLAVIIIIHDQGQDLVINIDHPKSIPLSHTIRRVTSTGKICIENWNVFVNLGHMITMEGEVRLELPSL